MALTFWDVMIFMVNGRGLLLRSLAIRSPQALFLVYAVKNHADNLAAFILDLQHEGVQFFDVLFLQSERQKDEGGKLFTKHADRTGAVKVEGFHIAEHGTFGKEHACIIFIRLQIAHTVRLGEVVICEIQMGMKQGFEELRFCVGFIVKFTENRFLLDRIQLDRKDRCIVAEKTASLLSNRL